MNPRLARAIEALRRGDPRARRLLPRRGGGRLCLALLSGCVAFFAVLSLALFLASGRLAASWQSELGQTATLQIVAPPDEVEAQARAALNVLRATPGVHAVRMVEFEEQRALLAPWLGSGAALDELPLPLLIDVEADRSLDRPGLEQRLALEAPAAVFDDHSAWRDPLVLTAERLRLFALGCLAVMALSLAAILAIAVQGAVAANAQAIETLRLIGARDGVIAHAFSRRFTLRALAGASAGAAAATLLLTLLPSSSEQGFFLVGIGLVGWHWMLPLAIPAGAGAVAWLTTALTTRRNLRRWS